MARRTINVNVIIDDTEAEASDVDDVMGAIEGGIEEYVLNEYAPDNPNSDETFFRYDDKPGPYVVSVEAIGGKRR